MMDVSRPRGTRDFGPREMAARRTVEGRMRAVMDRHGYGEIQTPTFEHADLFIAKSGPQVLEQIYDFKDKGDRHMALRPEMTAAVMRFYASDMKNEPKPVRVFYFGNCFRYERPQKGRYREFWQMGLEYMGKRTPLANAEVVNLAIECLQAAGIGDFFVRIGHVSLLGSLLKEHGIDPARDRAVMIAIDKKDRSALEKALGYGSDPTALLDMITEVHDILEAEKRLSDLSRVRPELLGVCDEVQQVLDLLSGTGSSIRFDPSISRGLDYYNGLVFEIDIPTLGAEKQVCGGGAYSLESVFGSEIDGIGFAIGFDRIMVALGDDTKTPSSERGVLVIPMDQEANRTSFEVQRAIVKLGRRCLIETQGRNIKKALSSAVGLGVRYAIIIGSDEVRSGSVTFKDLSTGDQLRASMEEIARLLS